MGFEIKADPEFPRPPVKRPINYMSRAVRLRIFGLFAMLILVLIMMKEARKPERWEWMGFDKQPIPAAPNVDIQDDTVPKDRESAKSDDPPLDRTEQLADLIERGDTSGYPSAGEQFWRESFASLETSGQRALFQFLRAVSDRTPIEPEQSAGFGQLVTTIDSKRDQFHNRLDEQISFLSDGSKQKQKLLAELEKSREFWNDKIRPSWELTLDGKDITLAQQSANRILTEFLNTLALDQVEDGTALNRTNEGSAWLLSWERAMNLRPQNSIPVMHIQLASQPEVYRGKTVTINGWVRSARRLDVKENEIGIDHYFVLWVRPADTNIAPYCVYSLKLPLGFPAVRTDLVEMNERLKVDGVFFKIRSYRAANDRVETCPLLLAQSFEWNPVNKQISVDAWTPPAWAIWCFFLLMPIVAGIIAWFAFVGSKTHRFVPGQKTQEQISKALGGLKNDPRIQTDLEKVQALYDSQDDNSHAPGDSND